MPSTLNAARLSPHVGCVIEGTALADAPEPAPLFALLEEYGAVLLRGFVGSPDQFVELTGRYCSEFSAYEGGLLKGGAMSRTTVGGHPTLFSTTGAAQGFKMPLHGEMYNLRRRPSLIWFFCETPPANRGQTTLCDGELLWRRLPTDVQEALRGRNIVYRRSIPIGDLEQVVGSASTSAIELFCARAGVDLHIDEAGGTAAMTCMCPPVTISKRNGAPCFINIALVIWHAEQVLRRLGARADGPGGVERFPVTVRWEDGSEMEKELIDRIEEAAEACTADVEWVRGDVLMVDNRRVMHGRRDARGSGRSILVRMGEPLGVV